MLRCVMLFLVQRKCTARVYSWPHATSHSTLATLHAGERFEGSADPATQAAAAAIKAAEAEELAEKRRAKKAAFDAEYDEGEAGGCGRWILMRLGEWWSAGMSICGGCQRGMTQ